MLSIHPNTLRKRMDRLGIPYGKKQSVALNGAPMNGVQMAGG